MRPFCAIGTWKRYEQPFEGCSYSVFDFDPLQLLADGLGTDQQKRHVGHGVKRSVGKCGHQRGGVSAGLKPSAHPKHAPYVHDGREGHGGRKTVKVEEHAAFEQRL